MRPQATVVLDGFGTLESLRWHDGALWFCDFAHGTVHRWDTLGKPETVVEVPGRAGGLGWLPDGRMLVVSMDGRRVHRQELDGSLVVHAELGEIAGGPVNDMLVDGQGRAYVGNFGFDYHGFVRQRPNAMLYAPPGPPGAPLACLSPEGELLGLSEPLVFPNGCFLIDEGRTLLVAETLAMRLTALPVLPDGRLGPPRPWAPLVPAWLWKSLNRPGVRGRITRRVSSLLDHQAIADRSDTPIAPDGIAPGRTARPGSPTRCAASASGSAPAARSWIASPPANARSAAWSRARAATPCTPPPSPPTTRSARHGSTAHGWRRTSCRRDRGRTGLRRRPARSSARGHAHSVHGAIPRPPPGSSHARTSNG